MLESITLRAESTFDVFYEGSMEIFQHAPFLDFEVIIDEKKYLYNRTILAMNSITILNFIKEMPDKALVLNINDIEPEKVKIFLDSFFGTVNLPDNNPIPFLILADYFDIGEKRIQTFSKSSEYFIKTHLSDFVDNYKFPFTPLSKELESIVKFGKYPRIGKILEEVMDETKDFIKTNIAAHIHFAVKTQKVSFDWLYERLCSYNFPLEFYRHLDLPHLTNFAFEITDFQIYETSESRRALSKHVATYKVLGKKKENQVIPLNSMDKKYLEHLQNKIFLKLEF